MGFIIAFIISLLSGMGVGGGGLFALYLKYFSEYSQIEIQAANLIFFLFAAGAALTVHLQKRRIYLLPIAIMIALGIPGSLLGSRLAVMINGRALGRIFGVMMMLAGIYSLVGKK